jgi:hypothetical protein
MRFVGALALAGLALLASAGSGAARIHAQMYCWEESELPVPCEYEDDEDESDARIGVKGSEIDLARGAQLAPKPGA